MSVPAPQPAPAPPPGASGWAPPVPPRVVPAPGAFVAQEVPAGAPVNPPPPQAALAVWIVREVVALLFVVGWLLLVAGELITGTYVIPFWIHVVGVGVLAYALGINVAQLTAFRPPLSAAVG